MWPIGWFCSVCVVLMRLTIILFLQSAILGLFLHLNIGFGGSRNTCNHCYSEKRPDSKRWPLLGSTRPTNPVSENKWVTVAASDRQQPTSTFSTTCTMCSAGLDSLQDWRMFVTATLLVFKMSGTAGQHELLDRQGIQTPRIHIIGGISFSSHII